MSVKEDYDDFQQRNTAWQFWHSQSSEYRLNHPEPPKPGTDTANPMPEDRCANCGGIHLTPQEQKVLNDNLLELASTESAPQDEATPLKQDLNNILEMHDKFVDTLKGGSMFDLKKGDIIAYGKQNEIVLARLEDLVFTAVLNDKGGRGPVQQPQEIDDLVAFGWVKI